MADKSITFSLPDLGEGLVEATVLDWEVSVGDEVERNAPLVEVETTKSAVVIPSPHEGRVTELHAAPGEVVGVGAPLVTFTVPADDEPRAGIVGTVPEEEKRPRRRVRLTPPSE